MCKGKQTEMTCGHVLTQYTGRCQYGEVKPCRKPVLDAPMAYINDSCANCDPEFNMNKISREHSKRHAELIEQVYANQKAGRPLVVQQLLAHMESLRLSADKALGEAKARLPASVHVEFPGAGNMASSSKWTSRWIDGKCVWEEERPWKPGMGKVKRVYRAPTPPKLEEEAEAQAMASRPPRMRTTKQGYTSPASLTPPKEQPPISGEPRMRQEKRYSGPRENYVTVEQPEPKPQRSLRRTKRYVDMPGLIRSSSDVTDRGSEAAAKHKGKERVYSTGPAKKTVRFEPERDEVEDVWLKLADQTINNPDKSFSQRMKETKGRKEAESRFIGQRNTKR
ncbi:hypothetical protein F5Y13DRAFT_203593 [Hypoxylon sp. FL1857]|nr:hypothetical protein F5Y13DRAFT_203593 [Hypoxylon sp. FL1857]